MESFEDLIPQAADAGLENVICMSGNRAGLDDEQGLVNCAKGVKRLMKLAEAKKVNVVHGAVEQQGRTTRTTSATTRHGAWKSASRVGFAARQTALRHLSHADHGRRLIATITKSIECIAHFHTGGVPGRHEIDDTQEIYYPAVMRAIVETGFKGFVAQEFVPKNPNALESLRRSIQICDV